MRALTRVADEACEEELLELAGYLTTAQLERALGAYQRVTREQARESHERAFLDYFWDDDGSLLLRARLPAEDGAVLLRALEAARDSLRERRRAEGGEADRLDRAPAHAPQVDEGEQQTDGSAVAECAPEQWSPPRRPTNVESLVAVAEAALSATPGERSGGERCQVVVHVDAPVLAADADGRCELEDGPALAPETARRLACDSSLVRIAERDGEALSVGRKTRTIPPALRRALKTRDRGCQFPGCDKQPLRRRPPRPPLGEGRRNKPTTCSSSAAVTTDSSTRAATAQNAGPTAASASTTHAEDQSHPCRRAHAATPRSCSTETAIGA